MESGCLNAMAHGDMKVVWVCVMWRRMAMVVFVPEGFVPWVRIMHKPDVSAGEVDASFEICKRAQPLNPQFLMQP
jgi:hypothetical protein